MTENNQIILKLLLDNKMINIYNIHYQTAVMIRFKENLGVDVGRAFRFFKVNLFILESNHCQHHIHICSCVCNNLFLNIRDNVLLI